MIFDDSVGNKVVEPSGEIHIRIKNHVALCQCKSAESYCVVIERSGVAEGKNCFELFGHCLKSLFDEFCTDEALTQFKAQNDWDLSINEQKLEKAPITSPMLIYRWSHRGDGITVNLQESDWTEVMTEVAIQNGHEITDDNKYTVYLSYVSWMADDDYGRSLYYVDGRYYVYGDNEDDNISHRCYYLEMVAITDPDGSFDPDTFMMELTDKENYQSVIKELKQLHGWNEPFEEVEE